MFDPFFPLLLLAGPVFLALLIWMELQRRTSSFRPNVESYFLGFIAAFGMSQWLTLFAVERYGKGMTAAQFNRVVLLSYAGGAILVIAAYLIVAVIRRQREIT